MLIKSFWTGNSWGFVVLQVTAPPAAVIAL
jgi:hypothetical protein